MCHAVTVMIYDLNYLTLFCNHNLKVTCLFRSDTLYLYDLFNTFADDVIQYQPHMKCDVT